MHAGLPRACNRVAQRVRHGNSDIGLGRAVMQRETQQRQRHRGRAQSGRRLAKRGGDCSFEAFAESLRRLTERNKEDAFVILEDRVSGKFVQFGRGTTIKIDLPLAALDEMETDRAADWFRNLGVESPRSFDAPDPRESGKLRSQASFEFDFGTDARRAAYSALDLFAAVYQLSDGVVWNIIEN